MGETAVFDGVRFSGGDLAPISAIGRGHLGAVETTHEHNSDYRDRCDNSVGFKRLTRDCLALPLSHPTFFGTSTL